MEKPNFKHVCYLRIQQLTNFPFIEDDFDSLTNYGMLCKIVEYLNKVISNENNQNESIIALYDAFVELKTYVDNFFDNLDVQDEINNKLDEMLEDGALEQIIEQFLQSTSLWCFDSVEDMKDATNLINGSYAKTLGYYGVNDGGGALYRITNEVELGEHQETLDNGNYATLITNGTVYIKQFGAKGDGETDDSLSIKNALKYHENNKTKIIFNPATQYNIKGKLYLYSNTEIDFNNQKIKITEDNTRFLNYGENDLHLIENITLKNGYFDGYNAETYCYLFKFALLRVNNLKIENNTFYCVSYHGHTFDMGGCTNVNIKDNYWHNVYNAENINEAELIQLDLATYSGLPYWEEESLYYNGQPCKNVIIENNVFKQDNKLLYGRMNAIGSHSFNKDIHQENIIIKGNIFDDPAYANIKLDSWKDVYIENNTFNVELDYPEPNPINTASLYNIYGIFGRDGDDVNNCENINISNNTFNNLSFNNKIIPIWFNGVENSYHKNINIKNNIFNGSYDGDSNKGAMFTVFSRCSEMIISGNIINNSRAPFYSLNTANNIIISNNLINNYRTEYYFNDINNLTWENNVYYKDGTIQDIKSNNLSINLSSENVDLTEGFSFNTSVLNNVIIKNGDLAYINCLINCNIPSDNSAYDVGVLPNPFKPKHYQVFEGHRGVNGGYGVEGTLSINITTNGMIKVRNNTGNTISLISINNVYNLF